MNTYCPKHSISPHRKNRRPWTRRRRTRSRMLTRCTPWWTRWRWSTWCAPWRRPQPFPGPRTGGGRRGVGPRWRTRGQQCCPTRTTPYWACTALPPCPTTSCCRLGLLYTSSLGRTGEAERERWGGGVGVVFVLVVAPPASVLQPPSVPTTLLPIPQQRQVDLPTHRRDLRRPGPGGAVGVGGWGG